MARKPAYKPATIPQERFRVLLAQFLSKRKKGHAFEGNYNADRAHPQSIRWRGRKRAQGALWRNGRCYFRLEDLWIWLTVQRGFSPANKGELLELMIRELDARRERIKNQHVMSILPIEPIKVVGKMSTFGGINDSGQTQDENLSLYWTHEQCDLRPDLFLPRTPENEKLGTSKRLDPTAHYIAIRFPKSSRPVEVWRRKKFLIKNPSRPRSEQFVGAAQTYTWLCDWGPNENTGRVADVSPAIAKLLKLQTDDICEVCEVP